MEAEFREKVQVGDKNAVMSGEMDDVSGIEKRSEAWALRNARP